MPLLPMRDRRQPLHQPFDLGSGHRGPERPGVGVATGFAAGTRVATRQGWRSVEALVPGDEVLTFDAGMQPVTAITRSVLWTDSACPRHLWPLQVPAGALGNTRPMQLLPEQLVMIESDLADRVLGDPFALVPAAVLDGVAGITRTPPQAEAVEVISIHFAEDQVVFANIGALFHCPRAAEGALDMIEATEAPLYEVLPKDLARVLVEGVAAEREGGALC